MDSKCEFPPVIPPADEISTVMKAPKTAKQIAVAIKRDEAYECPEYRKQKATS